jgi:propionyl-CoA carboxylase alpha chain
MGQEHEVMSTWRPGQRAVEGLIDGEPFVVRVVLRTKGLVLRHRGVTRRALVCTPAIADLHTRLPEKQPLDTSKLVISPMPGLVVSVSVSVAQEVKAGEPVLVVEAMKMQNIIRAEADGVVKSVSVSPGDSVAADQVMVEFA